MSGSGGGRGYWISPEDAKSDRGQAPEVPKPTRAAAPSESATDSAGRRPERGQWSAADSGGMAEARPRGHRRALIWMVASLVVLVTLGVLAALVVTGRVVVPVLSAKLFPIHYQQEIGQLAAKYEQDPYLVAAMVKAESGYDPQAESGVGAVGLMQLMPATAEWVAEQSGLWSEGDGPDLTNPLENLELGVWYLEYLGDSYGEGSLATLAAYNGGLGNVDDWIAEAGSLEAFEASDIQFPETREYVERIEHYLDIYRRVHPDAFSTAG